MDEKLLNARFQKMGCLDKMGIFIALTGIRHSFLSFQLSHLIIFLLKMAAAQMNAAASSRVFLPPFKGLRPSTIKVSSVSFRTSGGLTLGSTRGLVVGAATTVVPNVTATSHLSISTIKCLHISGICVICLNFS